MSTPKIAFENVSCSFLLKDEEVHAVGHVSLDIADGEIVTLVGPSGCGKSTLNEHGGGPAGADWRARARGRSAGRRAGPQARRHLPAVRPVPVAHGRRERGVRARDRGVPASEREATVARCLDLVGLSAFAGALPKNLSGGMKQRCAIARAYAVNPAVLLMDEPFGALDALTRITLQDQLLDTWKRDRRTILFITHDVDEAVYLAHRVIVMAARPGRIHAEIKVDLPFPRDEAMRLSSGFRDLRNRVWNAVFHQR